MPCIHKILFKDRSIFARRREFHADDAVSRQRYFIQHDIPRVLSHQIFSPYSEIVTVTRSFPTTRLTPRQHFAQLVSNDAAKRRGPLECTYILNLTYAHLLRTASTLCSSPPALFTSAPFSLLRALVKTHALTRALTYVSTHSRDREHTGKQERTKKRKRMRERERRWLIRTCVMTIANHLLNGTDTYQRATLYLLTIAKGSFKSEPECPGHIIVYFVNLPRSCQRYLKPPVTRRSGSTV